MNNELRTISGEVTEWSKVHDWKSCGRIKLSRGFESLPLRQLSLFEFCPKDIASIPNFFSSISSRVNLEQIQITKREVFLIRLASFLGKIHSILLQKVGGRQVNFTKILENKGFRRKLVKNF